jgi:hypothetical protein
MFEDQATAINSANLSTIAIIRGVNTGAQEYRLGPAPE